MRLSLILLTLVVLTACDGVGGSGGSSGQGHYREVSNGETLFSIAEEEYGNGLLWPEIRRFNPWVQPNQLHDGELLYIPPLDSGSEWGRESRQRAESMNPSGTSQASAPPRKSSGGGGGGASSGRRRSLNLPGPGDMGEFFNEISSQSLFGVPLPRLGIVSLLGLLLHSFVQSILVWLATIFTFVRDTSFKKSMKAVFLTETLTFATLLILGLLAVFLLFIGGPESGGAGRMMPTVEEYLTTNSGIAVAAIAVLAIYVVLSLRFYPQSLGIRSSQAAPVLILAVLIPHVLVLYLMGQRLGIVPH